MSGRRGRRVPAGRELADHLIERINDLRLENPYPGKVVGRISQYSEILGGYIRSYAFQYEDDASYFQGSIFFESPADDKGIATVEATFIILDEEHEEGEAGRIVGQNVYDSTAGFYGYRDSIANIYLTAYCSKIDRWVIAYERFDSYFDDVIPGCPPFYENESGSRVSQFWIDTIRQIIESLSCIHGEGVVHGRMYSSKSYVVDSNMTLKLVNIGRYSRSGVSTSHGDITGFFDYLCSQSSLGVSSSQEWVGFEYLYRSEEAMNNRSSWENALLDHPILLRPPAKLVCYMDIHGWTSRLNMRMRLNFANALYCKMPSYLELIQRGEREGLWDFIDKDCNLCVDMAGRIFMDKIYIDIIYFVRHFADHGRDYGEDWNAECIHDKIWTLFPGYMSMAYSVREVNYRDSNQANAAWNRLFSSSNLQRLNRRALPY